MSYALEQMHYEMGFHSPFNDQVELGNCVAIDKAEQLEGGWLCSNAGVQFVVGHEAYQRLIDVFGDCHEPAALIGLGRQHLMI